MPTSRLRERSECSLADPPAVDPPQHRGFGSRLIEHALPADLDGDVQLEFDPAGVRCTIEFVIENERRTQLRMY